MSFYFAFKWLFLISVLFSLPVQLFSRRSNIDVTTNWTVISDKPASVGWFRKVYSLASLTFSFAVHTARRPQFNLRCLARNTRPQNHNGYKYETRCEREFSRSKHTPLPLRGTCGQRRYTRRRNLIFIWTRNIFLPFLRMYTCRSIYVR